MIQISGPQDFKSSEIPSAPGVYIYKDEAGEILYVGKAKNLRPRVKSYFANGDQPAKTRQLLMHIRQIDWVIVNNEVDSLLSYEFFLVTVPGSLGDSSDGVVRRSNFDGGQL